jgi:hypothetical protein
VELIGISLISSLVLLTAHVLEVLSQDLANHRRRHVEPVTGIRPQHSARTSGLRVGGYK